MKIKVCGMRDAENIREVEALGVDCMGFIFYEGSSRYVSTKPAYLPTQCKRAGVFVSSTVTEILEKCDEFGLDIVQLHGNESADFCSDLRKMLPTDIQTIKMLSISDGKAFSTTKAFMPYVDYFLFESPCREYGGSGKQFDWSLLDLYRGDKPFILTGGIGPDDASRLMKLQHSRFAGIDLNSRFEIAPAMKSVELLKQLINNIRTS